MTILLPALAVAFAAFCVWLTVRIVNRRERWAKWTLAVTLSLPVLYVGSIVPLPSIHNRADCPVWLSRSIEAYFEPLDVAFGEPKPVKLELE